MDLIIGNDLWRNFFNEPDPAYDAADAKERFCTVPEMGKIAGFNQDELIRLQDFIQKHADDAQIVHFWDRMVRAMREKKQDLIFADPELSGSVENSYTVNLMALLACIPDMEHLYRERGWYDIAWDEALLDIRIWMEYCRENFSGALGVSIIATPWIWHQQVGTVIRLGRLQCNTAASFFSNYRVFRHKRTGELLAMVNDTMTFNAAGKTALDDAPAAFTTSPVLEFETTITGNPIGKDGLVSATRRTIAKADWDEPVKSGDPVINLHIPADGPMTPELCRDSMRKMYAFFQEKMHVTPKAFICESWILDPTFREILPEKSNLVKFQKSVYLLPWPGKSELVRRVFGEHADAYGINTVPHNTTMRRCLAEYMNRGGNTRNGAMFLLPSEVID